MANRKTLPKILPNEILFNIFTRLPVKSCLRCKSLSKYWKELIASPEFIHQHLHHAKASTRIILSTPLHQRVQLRSLISISTACYPKYSRSYRVSMPRDVYIVGSCNGLLCLSDYANFVIICNPVTAHHIEDSFGDLDDYDHRWLDLGFGHDPRNDEYKVVRIIYGHKSVGYFDNAKFDVYSSITRGWRRISGPSSYCLSFNCGNTYVNGALHWYKLIDRSDRTTSAKVDSIMAFNVGTEEFVDIPPNKPVFKEDPSRAYLTVFEECLCSCYLFCKTCILDIWAMKEYGVKKSWTMLYSIQFPPGLKPRGDFLRIEPLVVYENGEMVLKVVDSKGDFVRTEPLVTESRGSVSTYSYDLTDKSVGKFYCESKFQWENVVSYVESLVSLPGALQLH
ncbi:hypothetical protein ACHQM5_006834 [Ranunculus cassubicifolius]